MSDESILYQEPRKVFLNLLNREFWITNETVHKGTVSEGIKGIIELIDALPDEHQKKLSEMRKQLSNYLHGTSYYQDDVTAIFGVLAAYLHKTLLKEFDFSQITPSVTLPGKTERPVNKPMPTRLDPGI